MKINCGLVIMKILKESISRSEFKGSLIFSTNPEVFNSLYLGLNATYGVFRN